MDRIHIRLQPGARCWFTSDQHFDHVNVVRFCNRPWGDIKDMNKALTDRWNEVVGDDDVVFVLGDFCWRKDPVAVKKKIDELRGGHIFILPGNHDTDDQFKLVKKMDRVDLISDTAMIFVSGIDEDKPSREHELMLSHFPLATWPHFRRGTLNLHGHIHSGPRVRSEVDQPGFDLILKPGLTYDVGVDNNDYYPVEIRDILNKLNKQVIY
jgi:calcineurin-like phosphoesterase family protein